MPEAQLHDMETLPYYWPYGEGPEHAVDQTVVGSTMMPM